MILTPAIVEVKPADVTANPRLIACQFHTDSIEDEFDAWLDSPEGMAYLERESEEAAAMDRLDAGLLPW